MNDPRHDPEEKANDTTPGKVVHEEAVREVGGAGAPARRAGASEAELGRAHEAGLNTDSRGGIGSARRAGSVQTDPAPESGLTDAVSTEPRSNTRIGRHSSQGLAGAQGSGGGAERGLNDAPKRRSRP